MKHVVHTLSVLLLLLTLGCSSNEKAQQSTEVNTKIDSLLQQMTIEEKVGQMTRIHMTKILKNSRKSDSFIVNRDTLIHFIKNYHVGSFASGSGIAPEYWYKFSRKLQKINSTYSTTGIPIIYGVDHIHGAGYLKGSTIFPHNINIGATFNEDFAGQTGKITAIESADLGHHMNFAPVLDVGVNPVWSRFYETYGEDPHLASTMGAAYIKEFQDSTHTAPYQVAACAKHFIGYSDPVSGWDRTPAHISQHRLHEIFLPPFKAAIDAGVKTVMINSGEVNGVPVHASKEIITNLLRNKLQFKGVVLTDYADIKMLHNRHHIASTEREATKLAIKAGIDVSMVPASVSFCKHLTDLVKSGEIAEERINESVRRILQLKFDLGLFDHPLPRNDRFHRIGNKKHKQIALQAARESLVLLKNKHRLLPLDEMMNKNILVVGPNADLKKALCGSWTLTWQGNTEAMYPENMPTLFTALQNEFPQANVELIKDTITKNDVAPVFRKKARNAEVIVFAGGEHPYTEGVGNINDLRLDQTQRKMVQMIHKTGKPMIMVLIEGRPRIITRLMDQTEAVLWAGLPGYEGATAIAEVISGAVNPSGKLSFTYPKYTNHITPYHKKITEAIPAHQFKADTSSTIAPFGYGLSYTTFTYHNLQLSDTVITPNTSIKASVEVKNTGSKSGKESVLWFIRDQYRKITPNVKLLKHYEKKSLEPGETKTYTFTIDPAADLSYPGKNGNRKLEEGVFSVIVGDRKKSFELKK